jgi:glutamate-1-semialdehyde 2,1-aminomutase
MLLQSISHSGLPSFWLSDGHEIIFERGYRGQVVDTHKKIYDDFILGFGPVILGHNHPIFLKKLTSYLEMGLHFPGYSYIHEQYIQSLFNGLEESKRVCFFKTGSEAISGALRIAAMYTKRLGIIRCGFIGWHDAQIASSTNWHEPLNAPLRQKLRYMDYMRGVNENEIVLNWTTLSIEDLQYLLENYSNKIGAFVIDAYQLVYMDLITLKKALNLCRNYNILIIFDETKIGGRCTRASYAIENNLDVDLIVFGKSLANGAPLSLLVGDEKYLKLAKAARITGTYSKELLSIYCALATLEVMKLEDGYTSLCDIGNKVVNTFNEAAKYAKLETEVFAKTAFGGTIFDIQFSESTIKLWEHRERLLSHLADNHILILQGHPSFVCLDHKYLDYDDLSERMCKGLRAWGSSL